MINHVITEILIDRGEILRVPDLFNVALVECLEVAHLLPSLDLASEARATVS
jgi:hypothetical protein